MATAQAPESNYFARKANRFLAALIFRDFRFLAMATLCSGSGAWALIVARGSWIYNVPALQDAQTAGLWVGLVTFAAMSPRFFATPFIGYLADRVTRKRLLQWVYVLQLAQASVMAVLVMMGVDNPWYVVILAIVNGTLRATQQTAAQALAPNLVDRERLPNAVALNEAMQQGSRAVGPAILLAVAVSVGAGALSGVGQHVVHHSITGVHDRHIGHRVLGVRRVLSGCADLLPEHQDRIQRQYRPPAEFLGEHSRGILLLLPHPAGFRHYPDGGGPLRTGDVV